MTKILIPSLLSLGLPLHAATISLQEGVSGYDHISKDIRSQPATNNGPQMLVGNQPGGVGNIRTLMSFGLGSLPAGAVINSISLTLTTDSPDHSGTIAGVGVINLHEIIPNGVAANNMTDSGATWSNWSATDAWTTAGGDYTATAMSSAVYNNTNSDTKLLGGETAVFGSSAQFVAAAQAAFDAGLPLEFILIAPTAEAASSSNFFRFISDNHATVASRPLLVIDYTIPEPSTAGLLVLSGGLFVRRKRRVQGHAG